MASALSQGATTRARSHFPCKSSALGGRKRQRNAARARELGLSLSCERAALVLYPPLEGRIDRAQRKRGGVILPRGQYSRWRDCHPTRLTFRCAQYEPTLPSRGG